MQRWCEGSVQELAIVWGRHAARAADGGLGHRRQVVWIRERVQTPWRPADPGGFLPTEVLRFDAALGHLPDADRQLVAAAYRPGHLRALCVAEGRRLSMRPRGQSAASLRALAEFYGCPPSSLADRLARAHRRLADVLNATG